MSNSPLLRRPNSGLPQPLVMPLQASVQTVFSSSENDSDAILDTLRGALATGASELDPILTAIAEAAQTLTGASGSALALRTDGGVICRARAGETAPEIGAQISESSGISGECLRSGKILRCDDTQRDYRVNPEVCRGMGLHSMALVPIRAQQQIVGVLEVFSTRAYAFGDAEISMLRRVSELAETAYLQELTAQVVAEPESAPAAELTPAETWTHPNEDALRRLGTHVTIEELRIGRIGRSRLLVPVAVLVVLLGSIGWKLFSRHAAQPVAAAISSTSTPAQETGPVLAASKSSGKHSRTRGSAAGMNVSVVRAPKASRDEDPQVSDIVKRTAATEAASDAASAAASETKPAMAEARAESAGTSNQEVAEKSEPAPKLETVAQTGAPLLGSLFASPVATPKLDRPVSAGVSGGALEHKVQPVYPHEALAQHLEGPVVLTASVNEQGKVQAVKTVSGNALLARAAMDAVRQWRYHPFELNGKPVATDTRVTVNFKSPAN